MNARPILFSEPMVRALLDGRKTQTRRVMKPQPPNEARSAGVISSASASHGLWWWLDDTDLMEASSIGDQFRCPYGVPGDLLWVRETFFCDDFQYPNGDAHSYRIVNGERVALTDEERKAKMLENMLYRADGEPAFEGSTDPVPWRPSIHMPRWASRLTLRVTDVRVQRVQDISREDVIAEGIEPPRCPKCGYTRGDCHLHMDHHLCGLETPTHEASAFASLWDSLHKDREAWAANPWVWALTFEVLRENVDAVMARDQAEVRS